MKSQYAVAAIAVASSTIIPTLAAEASRPRGVGPEFAKYFKSTEEFTCINNPQISIPLSRVNDDVCDCPDGSDEPGTSACSYISPFSPPSASNHVKGQQNDSAALPGFYCKNKRHRPSYVPSSYVNDGVCDYELCCDGSDEWAGVGGVKCADRCAEIGKEWRKADEQRQRSLGAATKKRSELVQEAARLKKECEDRIYTLKTQIQGAEIKVKDLEKQQQEIEQRERLKVVKAPKEGGKLGVLIEQAKQRTDELRTALQRVAMEKEMHQHRLQRLEDIMKTFKEEYNPNFNDEGVKRAVRAWDDYAAEETTPGESQDESSKDVWVLVRTDEENGLDWNEFESSDSGSDTDVLYQLENYLPAPVRGWVNNKLRDLRALLVANGILPESTSTTDISENKAVKEAQAAVDAANNDLNTARSELAQHEDDLIKDYGTDDIFRALKGRCVEQDSGEYTYELCWMESTTQKPKKGGGNTGMGSFTGFSTLQVHDEVPADGRGLGSGEKLVMKFENGQHCWNGPARSTSVVMTCYEKDEIWKIVEEEKCVYRMEVGTPAVCDGPKAAKAAAAAAAGGKDEL